MITLSGLGSCWPSRGCRLAASSLGAAPSSRYCPGMLRPLHSWLAHLWGFPAESSRVIIGSTGSGKSEGELVELVRLAERDGHGPLALASTGHWAHRGYESRIVYEALDATDRTLGWDMLPQSHDSDPSRHLIEDAQTRDDVAQCFMAQRNLATLADKPWTKEWLDAAISLCLSQPQTEPLTSLLFAFRARTPDYERLLRDCRRSDVIENLTGASRRLIELVCDSEVARLRSQGGTFDWLEALRERRLVAFDGGAIRSREIKRTLFLLVSMQVIHAVRRHFAETQHPLPVVLVLEEAGALGLVTPFVLAALQELRKAGLAIHLLTQSCLDFGDASLFESVLANAPWQCWYQVLSPADQELGAKALTNAAFDSLAVHFTRVRSIPEGEALGSPWRSRMRQVIDPYYKSPSLQEQEFRTQLATLHIGERLVRDRRGVRRERVRMIHAPADFEAATYAAIERIRCQPLYLPPSSPQQSPVSTPRPDAAERLRERLDLH